MKLDALKGIRMALENNSECRQKASFDQRIAISDNGPSGDRELLVHLCDTWYGHIQRAFAINEKKPLWVALIVETTSRFEWRGAEQRFPDWHEAMALGEFYPAFAQENGDVFALRSTMEEACGALAEMINRFSIEKRGQRTDPPDPPGKVDLRIFDVYGFGDCSANRNPNTSKKAHL